MTEVVTAIRRVTDIMGEISAASSEQSAGVGQVGEAVTLKITAETTLLVLSRLLGRRPDQTEPGPSPAVLRRDILPALDARATRRSAVQPAAARETPCQPGEP